MKKKYAVHLLCLLFAFCLPLGKVYAQDMSLEDAYMALADDIAKGDDCEQAFSTLSRNYFYAQRANGQSYEAMLQSRLNADPRADVLSVTGIKDLKEYPLLFLSSFIHNLYLNNAPQDYKTKTATWKNVKRMVKTMQKLVPDTKSILDKQSGFLLSKIMRKNKHLRNSTCLPPLIRDLVKLSMEEANTVIENLIDELKNDSTKLVGLKDEVMKGLDNLDSQKRLLNSLKLGKPDELVKKLGDNPMFLLKDAVGVKERIDISSFAVGQYCDNRIKEEAVKYAKRTLNHIHKVMDVRDSLVKIYTEMNKILQDPKNQKLLKLPLLAGAEAYKGRIDIEAAITGKADGSGGCYQENWANCPPIGYKYAGEWKDINEIISYSFDGGDKIKEGLQIRNASSGVNSEKLHILKDGAFLSNLSLAFLRGYCVGRTIEDATKIDILNKNNERYVYKTKYKAHQYKLFRNDAERAFEIETDFTNTNKTIGSFMLKIQNDMQVLRDNAGAIQLKIDDLTEALKMLRE